MNRFRKFVSLVLLLLFCITNFGCESQESIELKQALFEAVGAGDAEATQQLLQNYPEIDINMQNEAGETLLIVASKQGTSSIVRLLFIVQNLDVNKKDRMGRTALHWAAFEGQSEIVGTLLASGDELDSGAVDNDGRTASKLALVRGYTTIANEINEHSSNRVTPQTTR